MTNMPPREWFERWWEPAELHAAATLCRFDVSLDEFFSAALKPAREAIAATEFAIRRPWDRSWEVRLYDDRVDRFPDFKLRSDDEVRQFELGEAYREGRKRHDEHREAAEREARCLPRQWEHYDPDEEAAAAMPAVWRTIEKKAEKRYRPSPHLLVYVNFSKGEPTKLEVEELAKQWGGAFASAWLLWAGTVFPLW